MIGCTPTTGNPNTINPPSNPSINSGNNENPEQGGGNGNENPIPPTNDEDDNNKPNLNDPNLYNPSIPNPPNYNPNPDGQYIWVFLSYYKDRELKILSINKETLTGTFEEGPLGEEPTSKGTFRYKNCGAEERDQMYATNQNGIERYVCVREYIGFTLFEENIYADTIYKCNVRTRFRKLFGLPPSTN